MNKLENTAYIAELLEKWNDIAGEYIELNTIKFPDNKLTQAMVHMIQFNETLEEYYRKIGGINND